MDASDNTLLHQLVDAQHNEHSKKSDFITAMQRMGIESVFDIVCKTKAQFARELAVHTDADAEQVYNNALSFARQISRLYQEHQVSARDTNQRVRRSLSADSTVAPATYQALFKENWDQFCEDGDIAAIDSPVAYLRALNLFARKLENSSSSNEKVTLDTRRSDLNTLKLDHQSTFAAQPMLDIVNKTLRSQIAEHVTGDDDDTEFEEKGSIEKVLASECYPFSLPYNFHHQQCLLGLTGNKPALGAMNYRISRKLPFSPDKANYGTVSKPHINAQKLLSGLSLEQQKLLITPTVEGIALDQHLQRVYGTEDIESLHILENLKERTGLTTAQLEQMLMRGKYSQRASFNSPASDDPCYGANYINGPTSEQEVEEVLEIIRTEQNIPQITNWSEKRFDRLQRMIRLHRWTGIPFSELDTLIVSALRSEGSQTMELNDNTLRTLGVYRYLNQRHGIAPEEFASLLHTMPTAASGDRIPLFDQVFNRTRLLDGTQEEDPTKDLVTTDLKTFSYLGAGLGLPITQDGLLLLAKQTEKHLASLKHDLSTVSSLYRQARIARMFGLSPVECTALTHLLGGDPFCKLLVTGKLSPSDTPTTDLLDVLMPIDWAVDWLKQSNREVSQLSRLFGSTKNAWPLNQDLKKQLEPLRAANNPSAIEQGRLVESLLHDIADLPAEYVPGVMKMADTEATKIFAEVTNVPEKKPKLLIKVLRAAEMCQGLSLHSSTLETLMKHPKWLQASNSLDRLTPHTLYLLERFGHCAHQQARSEENLLHYLRVAADESTPSSSATANRALAELLNWTSDAVNDLAVTLPSGRVQSMEELDWLMRCKACCESTGLSANLLLKAAALSDDRNDWQTIGEAVIAACHYPEHI